ncbi:MAG: malonyl-ACP O-methyltransferase BioC [Steroidobacteraceae bacterium]
MRGDQHSGFHLDARVVARSFGAASAGYDAAADLQAEVRAELLARVDELQAQRARILDLGCGTGAGAAALKRRFPRARVVAADIAPAMVALARRRSRFWRPIETVVADCHELPFPDACFDLVFTNLMLQWAEPLDAALEQIRRVLRPGGLLLASSFGPETLQELRAAWEAADGQVHVNRFVDMHDLGSALVRAGFVEPVLDTDRHRRWYSEPVALMRGLQAIGAHNLNAGRPRGLTGRRAYGRMTAAYESLREARGLPATWQVVYATAWAGEHAPPGIHVADAETVVSLASLRRRIAGR